MKQKPRPTYLKDYRKPAFLIPEVSLDFDLYEDVTRVKSVLTVRRDKEAARSSLLLLNGEHLNLRCVKMNGRTLSASGYEVTETHLKIKKPEREFSLEIENEIKPGENKALEGLYKSGKLFCTQNEPEGFRKITYFLDRPDVMSRFTTTIRADRSKYPVLLSNGNCVKTGTLPGARRFAVWKDPFPKPCYLFALAAGDLGVVMDRFRTKSGRSIDLRIYVDKGSEPKCRFAMEALKKAMKWDEETFGLECDLDTYMIAAVQAFNMGAMENKGLNIFNAQYVLADRRTATDLDYEHILSVIGHEYFHNWTGNRVTCRDWFQITLKEGLTIFRDQEFSSDLASRAVKRISNVRRLRDYQFAEDAGPNRHPIQPKSYLEINNFYTPTVYEKGAEVIRMIETLIGKAAFRRGMKKYFELYDGCAVTTDDFIRAMEIASGADLAQFKRWYDEAGTPVCRVGMKWDRRAKRLYVTVEQKPPVSRSGRVKPFYFPLAVGFLDSGGKNLELPLCGEKTTGAGPQVQTTQILRIRKRRQTFVFENVRSKPIPSLLRNFSAPVYLEYPYSEPDLELLFARDPDPFNRFEAGQRLFVLYLERLREAYRASRPQDVRGPILESFGRILCDESLDPAFRAEALTLPSVAFLTERMKVCDFEGAFQAREFLMRACLEAHEKRFQTLYAKLKREAKNRLDQKSIGMRRLKNLILHYLSLLPKRDYWALAFKQFKEAGNMTDRLSALSILCNLDGPERKKALALFYEKWRKDSLVIDKWFAAQAGSKLPDVLERVKALEKDSAYDAKNPNKIRALVGVFAQNLVRFHDSSGKGYSFVADKILEVDRFNPITAARLATAFKKFRNLDSLRKRLARAELKRILSAPALSKAVYEIAAKTIGK